MFRASAGPCPPRILSTSPFPAPPFVENTIRGSDRDYWGDRLEEAAALFVPELAEQWRQEDETGATQQRLADSQPLVWKEVTVAVGSKVRMAYGGTHHYATVKRGHIVEDGDNREYSPSEWASKVAGGTSRNAWRDLWFREPLSKIWVPAQLLREQALEANARLGKLF
jgi:hypothetical protein